jgi:hypothetical protein
MKTEEIKEPHLLIVEGNDEENFFKKLLEVLEIFNVQIIDYGGKRRLRAWLKSIKNLPGFIDKVKSIGITRDADGIVDNENAFQSVQGALRDAGLPVPQNPLIPEGKDPRVIIMILPDVTKGMLEDLCLKSVKKDPAMKCVEEYFKCLKAHKTTFPKNLSKAKIQVFLASREEDVTSLGIAAQNGYWPLENKVFANVKKFLKKLVEELK